MLFTAIFLQIGALLLLFFDVSVSRAVLLVVAIPFAIFILSSSEVFFSSVFLISTCFHLHSYAQNFKGFFSVRLTYRNLYAIFTIFLLYWIVSLVLKKRKFKIGPLGYAILIYVLISVFAFFHGYIAGNFKGFRPMLVSEIFPQLMYLSFFVFLTTDLRKIRLRVLFDGMLIISAFIGIQIMYAFSQNTLAAFTRINTNTVQISLFAIPYVIAILFFDQSVRRKVFSSIALLPILGALLICLQRSLWLAAMVIVVVSILIFFYKRGFSIGKIAGFLIGGGSGIFLLFVVTLLVLSKITGGAAGLVILKRLISLVNIGYLRVDMSAYIRITEIRQALAKLSGYQWIIGRGIGDSFYSYLRTKTKIYFDNSYAWVLWKMGIIGMVSFLSIFFLFFKRVIFLIRQKTSKEDFIYIMVIGLNMLGIMICSLGNASLIKFRYIMMWAVSMAILEMIYRKYKNEDATHMFS